MALQIQNRQMKEDMLNFNFFFFWFTKTLTLGSERQLTLLDLHSLPLQFDSECSKNVLRNSMKKLFNLDRITMLKNDKENKSNDGCMSDKSYQVEWISYNSNNYNENKDDTNNHSENKNNENKTGTDKIKKIHDNFIYTYVKVIYSAYYKTIYSLAFLKILILFSNFFGPLMLGKMVNYIEQKTDKNTSNLLYGLLLVFLLGSSFLLNSILNTMFNLRANLLYIKLNSGFTLSVFERVMILPTYAKHELRLNDALIINVIQNDVDKISDIIRNINDLWSLPLQIMISFVLLYNQVKMAFLASIILIIVMIPINSLIAQRIGTYV